MIFTRKHLLTIWALSLLNLSAHAESCPSAANIVDSINFVAGAMGSVIESLPRKIKITYSPSEGNLGGSVHGWKYPDLNLEITGSKCGNGLSVDGFKMLVCHEIGHLAGGPPTRPFIFNDVPFSVEGEADFFAASVCLPTIFKDENNLDFLLFFKSEPGIESCRSKSTQKEVALCVRIAMAALDLTRYFYATWDSAFMNTTPGEIPTFQTKDQNVVQKTLEGHPTPQCRLDTYLLGAACTYDSLPLTYSSFGNGYTSCGPVSKIQKPSCWYHD